MPASSSSQIAAGPKIHQLWQAVILKPFKLQECILHFWKPLIFINLVSAGQDHSYVLNTRFWLQKRSTFHRACVIGVLTKLSATVLPTLEAKKLWVQWFWLQGQIYQQNYSNLHVHLFFTAPCPTLIVWLHWYLQRHFYSIKLKLKLFGFGLRRGANLFYN